MDENKDNLDNSIVQKIKKGEVSMRPKYVFYAIYSMLIVGIISLFLVSAWLVNILIYKLRVHSLYEYLSYGEPGIEAFWLNIPFGALLLALVTFIAATLLLRKFDFCYKKSFLFIVLGLLLALTFTSYFIDRLNVNETLDHQKYLYSMYHNQILNPDWLVATVIHRDPKGYYVRNFDGRFFRAVPITSNINLPVMNRTDCIKIKGLITDEYTIRTYNLYKCPYKILK